MSRRHDPKRSRTPPWWRNPAVVPILAIAAGLLAVLTIRVALDRREAAPSPSAVPIEVLAEGEALYAESCATCHGDDREGFVQPAVPAPPLDGSAHSWHHSDEQIIGLIRRGGSMMPAVGANWNDEEIEAVLAFVKSGWAPWQREAQAGQIGE